MTKSNYKGGIKKAFRLLFSTVRSFFNLAATLLLGLVLLSIVVSPERLSFLAYFGLLFPFIMLFILLLFIYHIAFRKWRGAIYVALLLVVAFPLCRVYLPLHRPAKELPQEHIKILSFNVMRYAYMSHSAQAPNPILRYLKESNADIICMQEAYLAQKSKQGIISYAQIKSYLSNYPYIDHREAQPRGSDLVLLSKFPIRHVRVLPLTSHFNGAVSYRLDIHGKELELINVHLESTTVKSKDGEDYLSLAKKGKAFELSKKISLKLGPSFAIRARQVDRLALEVATALQSTPYVILCGDFNDTPISYARYRLTANLHDLYVDTGSGAGYSYSFKKMGLRIDHILASKAIKGYDCMVDPSAEGSDHKPIYCLFTLQP